MLRNIENTQPKQSSPIDIARDFGDAKYKKLETILTIKDVSLTLGENVILKNVNAQIKNIVRPNMLQGQIVGILAPSGVGKTKLFEIMSGILKPTTGEVLIEQSQLPVKCGDVGVVYQNYPLFNHHTIYKNLELAANKKYKDSNLKKDAILEILKTFDLQDKISLYPTQLSGGQRQRIAIAQQMLCSEHFVLLDEPFSGLDVLMINEVCKIISQISNRDELNTMIVVTHDIGACISICDTLWLMGRDRDEVGKIIPGARIKYEYDLIEMGLAWEPDIQFKTQYAELVKEIKTKFREL